MDLEVKHDEPGRKYYALVESHESVCEYGPAGDKTLDFWHTYVPPELRGQGIAEELVRQALGDVRLRGYKGRRPSGSLSPSRTRRRGWSRILACRWILPRGSFSWPSGIGSSRGRAPPRPRCGP